MSRNKSAPNALVVPTPKRNGGMQKDLSPIEDEAVNALHNSAGLSVDSDSVNISQISQESTPL